MRGLLRSGFVKAPPRVWILSSSLSQTRGCRPTTLRVLRGHSHFDLFINGRREVELGKGLPFF